MRNKQQGSTLFGVLVALTVVSMLVVTQTDYMVLETRHIRARQTVVEANQIYDAIRNYYSDKSPSLLNRWPLDIDTLITDGYLLSKSNLYGHDWYFEISSDKKTAQLQLNIGNLIKYRRWIAAQLPQGEVTGNTIYSQINRPGDEAIHMILYPRDGTRNLTGNLDVGRQYIEKAGTVIYD